MPDARTSAAQQTLAFDPDTGEFEPRATLVTFDRDTLPTAEVAMAEEVVLPELSDIELGELIGAGGLGEVFEAHQGSLDRVVAIKRLRQDTGKEQAAAVLVHEARISGQLDHPGIVPVHLLARNADGQPVLVMKRLHGRSWGEALYHERMDWRRYPEWLDRQIRVVMSVCHALHFAHDRGILHRDVKPENVMIGSYGEVWLVDWGLAIRDTDPPPGRKVLGSPAYMAPEMARAEHHVVGPATDVYLVGASLYDVITGTPPHDADSPLAAVQRSATASRDPLPDDLDAELAAICERALAPHPDARFSSALELHDALADWLDDAPARRMLEVARQRHRDFDAARVHGKAGSEFEAVRFAYQMVLESQPGNQAARRGLQRVVGTMARMALAAGQVVTARVMVDALPDPDAELDAAVAKAEAAWSERQDWVHRLEEDYRELDLSVGRKTRVRVAVVAALFWMAAAIAHLAWPEFRYNALWAWGITVLILAPAWRSLVANRAARRLMIALLLLVFGTGFIAAVTAMLGTDHTARMAYTQVTYGVALGVLATTYDMAFVVPALAFIASSIAIAWDPAHVDVFAALARMVTFMTLAVLWQRQEIQQGTAAALRGHDEAADPE